MADAAADVDLVVESVPEQLDLKRDLYQALGEIARRDTIFASNTSSLPISDIADGVRGPERVVGTHYWNPPHLMPLVEIVAGRETSSATVERVDAALRQMGKEPILCRKEVPGFIWNRLQMALLREALWLVENGVASSEDVDLSIRKGLGRRYSGVGLFEAIDFGGVRTWDGISRGLFPHISDAHAPGPLLSRLVEEGRFGAEVGAGVYDWPPERREAFKARRDAQLLGWLRRDQAEREEGGL
jgi:3-hydroxybutyryl-CoA dehydrogenase